MTASRAVTGTVGGLVRYPVRSLLGEVLTRSHVDGHGLLGDGAFAVVDAEDGTVATAEVPGPWSGLLGLRATYTAEPEPGAPLPPVNILFTDGSTLRSDDEKIDAALSGILGREVRLAADPDIAPLRLLTTSTLDALAGIAPGATVDARRHRPHLLLEVPTTGWAEDDWVGRTLTVGEVAVGVAAPAVCGVLSTLAQDGLPADATVLDAVTRHHRLEVPGRGSEPCVGVEGEVTATGTVATGDRFEVR